MPICQAYILLSIRKKDAKMTTTSLRAYIRDVIVANLEGNAYDNLGMTTEKEVADYVKSIISSQLEKTIDEVIKVALKYEEHKEHKTLEEYIRTWEGDWFREIMASHIPSFAGEDAEDEELSMSWAERVKECGCGGNYRCCGWYPPHEDRF